VISRVGGLANTFTGAVLGVAVDTHDEGHAKLARKADDEEDKEGTNE